MESLLTAFLSLALMQNLLLTQAIGLSSALAVGGRLDTACAHALQTLLALVPAAVVAWCVDHWLLQGADATALRLLLWSPLCLAASALGQRWLQQRTPLLGERLASLPFLVASGHVLQLTVLWWVATQSPSLLRAVVDALALGVGYGLATILLSGWHARLASAGLPAAVSVPAAVVLSAAIASMAVLGLAGA